MPTATNESSTGTASYRERRGHQYHANAHLISGRLERPIVQEIPHQAQLSLLDWRGGHLYQRVQGYDLEGLISFKSGYTRVSGYRSETKVHPFVTLSTSVIEGLNVFDVLTADRVVAQVSTAHPKYSERDPGHVPQVTFLGTQFTNLKIGGYDVNLTLNAQICGKRPQADVPYLFEEGFLNRVEKQVKDIAKYSKIPKELKTQSETFRAEYEEELKEIKQFRGKGKDDAEKRELKCSLVDEIILPKAIPGVEVIRNVMYVRDFGIVTLGNISVGRKDEYDKSDPTARKPEMSNYFTIDMFDIRLGCVGEGKIIAASGTGNGKGKP